MVPNDHKSLKTRFVTTLNSLLLFSAINYRPFSPPDSFNLINKPDQTKATCHNNHCPTTFRHGLGRNTVWVGLRLILPQIPVTNHHIRCLNPLGNNFGVLNLPLHRHTWLSPSHNTVRLQETAREEQELTSHQRRRRKHAPRTLYSIHWSLVARAGSIRSSDWTINLSVVRAAS